MRLRAILVFFLMGAAFFVSAVPREDLPETTFNEADAPVILAPAERPSIQLVAPPIDLVVSSSALPPLCADCLVSHFERPLEPVFSLRHRRSLQDLLCTLLV
jgi:hypothetical protein